MQPRRYLDWNAGAPLLPEAAAAVAAMMAGAPGNPSSVHAEGRRMRALVENARDEVAALAGVARDEVVFTAGGSEANAAALHGLAVRDGGPVGRVLALPRVEHPSLLAAAEELARSGAVIRWLAVDRDGLVDAGGLADLLRLEAVAVVCVQLANSETGVVQPVERFAALARAHGAAVHCDAVQAAGKLAVDAMRLGADTVALSAHKLGGLPGSGALLVRQGTTLAPLVPGTQERHRRGGTENVPGIVAFGAAARLARERAGRWQPVAALREQLEELLLRRLPAATIYGRAAARLPNTSCLGLPPPCLGGVIVAALDLRGFAVSSGSACSSGVERGSAVVEAMGFGEDAARRTLRVSLGPQTGEEEVRALADCLAELAGRRKGGRP